MTALKHIPLTFGLLVLLSFLSFSCGAHDGTAETDIWIQDSESKGSYFIDSDCFADSGDFADFQEIS